MSASLEFLVLAADPPNLKTAKDQGDQAQLQVSPVQVLHRT